MPKKLEQKITSKLEQLQKLLNKFTEAQVINSDDPATWDSDTLYNLAANLKEALKLLENQTSQQLGNWGEPLVLATGLCSLLDDWESKKEEKND